MRRIIRAWVVVTLVGCSAGGSAQLSTPGSGEPPDPQPPRETADPSTDELLQGSDEVSFATPDRVRLTGRLFAGGSVTVVLAHMGNPTNEQSDWWELAGLLAGAGYTALTYNRRGVCTPELDVCSRGTDDFSSAWKDVVGASAFAARRGAEQVVVGGASIGAMTSTFAAARPNSDVDGLIWLAGVRRYGDTDLARAVSTIRVPKLFASGTFDTEAARSTRQLHAAARQPKDLVMLRTGEHGTDILAYEDPPIADELRQGILEFLRRHFG